MGLTGKSTGTGVLDQSGYIIQKETDTDKIIALAGNPNVGKSTVFNALTGLNQHTGNWPGKTVTNARGMYQFKGTNYIIVDLPGTYSLMANSVEEEVARDFICFGQPDVTVIVADATCLERNLNLVLQTMEITDKVVLCVNLMDEAKKKKISIRLDLLASKLGISVVGTSARSNKGLDSLIEAVDSIDEQHSNYLRVTYSDEIEKAISLLEPAVENLFGSKSNKRWVSLKLLEGDTGMLESLKNNLGFDLMQNEYIIHCLTETKSFLGNAGIHSDKLRDLIVTKIVNTCEDISKEVITYEKKNYAERDRKIDQILTSKITGIPIMILLLFVVFWLTVTGANYPSELIAKGLFWLEEQLSALFRILSGPEWISGALVDGIYRTLAWVVSVMLPPMAIFFPLFTLLEDSGYLPRIAFNMDNFSTCAVR
ncbi:MAG TPA: ferrous iron transporter B, partial [Clostridiales bacterium]|nr:ferrous iron transporter B [Clostridiales bacterium]